MSTGIKETKDVLIAANELTLVIIKHVKDGIAVADIPAIVSELMGSDAFKLALVEAVTGVTNVPAEIKDIDFTEGMELGQTQLAFLPRFLELK